jgi:FtsH-binding integral membrane protein
VALTAIPDPETRETDIGLDILKSFIQETAPLNAQVISNNNKRYIAKRNGMAMKIIGTFSGMAAAVSILPFIDIPLTMFCNRLMIGALEALSTSPKRTSHIFEQDYAYMLTATYAIRTGILLGSLALKFALLGLISIPIAALVTAATTSVIGTKAYQYFTESNDILEFNDV